MGDIYFEHVANYESIIVYYNAVMKEKIRVDYHAVPHAVFTYPEIASVGLKQVEAAKQYGEDRISDVGFQRYEDTAKGEAMDLKELLRQGHPRERQFQNSWSTHYRTICVFSDSRDRQSHVHAGSERPPAA